MNGIHRTERSETVAARACERDAVSSAAHADIRHPETIAVNRDESIDSVLQRLVEQPLDASQVAESFFADGADKGDAAWRDEARFGQHAGHTQHVHQTAAVIADDRTVQHRSVPANFHERAFTKARLQT